jgi:hypothetical protein
MVTTGLLWIDKMSTDFTHWPFLPTLIRLALAVGCGLFVGLEREHRGKAGVRTFGLAALLGCLGGLSGDSYAILAMVFLIVAVCFLNARQFVLHQTLGLTTSIALIIVGFAGILSGQGHTFTLVAVTIITAALLAWKVPISGFVVELRDLELRSAILLAILTFIIYPVLPSHAVDPWGLIEPQSSWMTVILIAAIGFVNYVLWKIYGPRGIDAQLSRCPDCGARLACEADLERVSSRYLLSVPPG